MPSLRDTIQPFVDRLLRDPGVLMIDGIFARAFGVLPSSTRDLIMDRVESVRRQRMDRSFERQHRDIVRMVSVDTGANGDATTVVSGHVSTDQRGISTVTIDEVAELTRSDEENARLDRIAQMRRDMAREIEEFRFQATEAYQNRMAEDRTTEQFQRWSQWVENTVYNMRIDWENRISAVMPRPTPPVVAWPAPADYGPSAGYRSVRGALSAFTRAVNNTFGVMAPNLSNSEARDRIHINGTRDIRIAWAGIPETARRAILPSVPPPPTTTVWVDEPEIDELDILIKHLPRGRKFMLVVSDDTTLSNAGRKLATAGITGEYYHIHTVKMMIGASSNAVRVLRYPVYIDPAVFKMHAARQGDWSDADLDAVIELQGEIPDEETMA